MRGILLEVAICLAVSSAMPAVAQQKNPLAKFGYFQGSQWLEGDWRNYKVW